MLDKKVVKEGTLILRDGTVYVGHDWDLSQPGMCREHAIAACLHTAQKLTQAAIDIIAEGGGADFVVSDLPDEATMRKLAHDAAHPPGFDALVESLSDPTSGDRT